MKDTKTSKYAVVSGILPLLVSLVIFTGTTWAWFADRVENTGNVVKTGSLDVKMYWSDSRWELAASDNVLYAETDWKDVEEEGHAVIFDCQNWYPGCEDVKYLKIVNTGSLPFRYTLNILSDGERKAESEALEDIAHMGNSSHMENITNPAEVVDVYWILYEEMPETGFSWESAQKALLSDFLKENVPRALTEGILAEGILTAGTYEITLTRQAGGAEGFCLLFLEEGENKITCFTQQIPDRIAFTLILQEETFLTVMPHWGRPDAYGYHESDEADVPQNIYITEGKTVEISSVETGTEH